MDVNLDKQVPKKRSTSAFIAKTSPYVRTALDMENISNIPLSVNMEEKKNGENVKIEK